MTMKNKRHIKQIKDRLNAVKAAIRQEEIQNHGKPISYNHVVKNKKIYSRKNFKKPTIDD